MAVEWAAIAAAIGAVAGVASGLVGTVQSGKKAWEAANDQQQHIKALYEINKKQAEEEFTQAKREAEKNADYARQQANLVDFEQNISEKTASADFNSAIDSLYLTQASDTFDYNLQAMQYGSSEGAGYASLGTSGVRTGSSLSEAVEMESAINENQLQFSQDAKRQNDSNSLQSLLNNLAGVEAGVMGNRVGADVTRQQAADLVNSYSIGGSNYNLYELQKEQLETTFNYNNNTLQKEKERYWKNGHLSWDAFLEGATAMLSLGAKGAQTGYQLYDMGYKSANYNKRIDSNTYQQGGKP